jgi:tRNA-dihydrouridine synthase 1
LEGKVDAVDLNFGCPQGIAKRGNYGAFLLEKPHILRALVTTLHNDLKLPVTCKMRILSDPEKTLALAKMLQECGCQVKREHALPPLVC